MAALLGPVNERGIKYVLVSPAGFRAVFNDSSDPDYVGPLSAEDGITGLDSAEIIESFTQRTEDDGAIHGNFFFGRRPITMAGHVVPVSNLDRATRLDKLLKCVKDSMRSNATLYFTPVGGEPCYINVRAQQPPRVKGPWVKEFFLSLVADDPRVYSVKQSTALVNPTTSGSPTFDRFTHSAAGSTTLATRTVYLPPGTWRFRQMMKRSSATGTLTINASSSTGTSTPGNFTAGWTEVVQVRATTNAEAVATTITMTLNAALGAGQWVELGPLIIESDTGAAPSAGATLGTNWVAGTGLTRSAVTASPPAGLENQGNTTVDPRMRLLGPGTAAYVQTFGAAVWFNPVAFISTDYLVLDFYKRTVVENNTTNAYGYVAASPTVWRGLVAGNTYPNLSMYGGGGATNILEVVWRNAYL